MMNIIKIFNRKILFFSFFIFILSCGDGSQQPVPELGPDGLAQASGVQPQLTVPGGSGETSNLAPREVDTPLPYQINFSTAAFMSCPGDTVPDDSVFFTFKFGAYTSGLQLDPDFDLQGTSTERQRALESSPLINAKAQLTLSKTGYPGNIIPLQNRRAIAEILTLNHPSVIQNLVQSGVSYRLGHNASVELKLPYPGNSLLNLLPSLNTKFTIYLAYNNGQDLRPLKKNEKYYGRYFNFNFNSKKSYLTGMRELDLQDDQSRGRWSCSEKLRFAIHRDPVHTRAVYKANRVTFFDKNNISAEWECQEDGSVLTKWEQDLFRALKIHQHFTYGKTVEWKRDSNGTNQPTLTNTRCVRPVDSTHHCYNNQNTAKVEFEESNCSLQGDRAKVCPAYLSVCVNYGSTESGS